MDKKLCVALGDFDGVHIGHRAVISAALQKSDTLTPAVYTFENNSKGSKSITDNNTKIRLFKQLGIEKVIFDDFEKIRSLTPSQFVNDILVSRLNVKTVVCGEDYRFGKDACGDVKTLATLCNEQNIEVIVVKLKNFTQEKISSSYIRELIEQGSMEKAAKLLGRCYSVVGTVHRGKHLGSANMTPTVNIDFENNSVIPCYGVYITRTRVGDRIYNSITNVGVRPSVENTDTPNAETNIFDFNEDLYGKQIEISFISMIRREQKFDSTEKLFTQIKADIQYAKSYFGENNND